jgi:long-chain acyl-CoA synthetase
MIHITRLFDFAYHQLEKYNLPDALVTKQNGVWIKTSTQEYIDKANTISRALLRMDIQKNDKIAIISSNNRTEWHIMDVGILQIGAQNVPIYPTISETDYEYILNHCEANYCFVSDDEVLNKVNLIKHNVPNLKEVFSFNEITGCKNWSEILKLGEDTSNQTEVEERKNNVQPLELATIIHFGHNWKTQRRDAFA